MAKLENVRCSSQSSSRALKKRGTPLRGTVIPSATQDLAIFTGLLHHLQFLAMTASYDGQNSSLQKNGKERARSLGWREAKIQNRLKRFFTLTGVSSMKRTKYRAFSQTLRLFHGYLGFFIPVQITSQVIWRRERD